MKMKGEAFSAMKIPAKTASFLAAALCWLLLSALAVFIVWGMRDRARLIRDNENERLFNMLFTELRNYDDFGSAIEANQALKERIAGFAVYGSDLTLAYSWGKVPAVFDEKLLEDRLLLDRFGRYTIPDRQGDSVKFILRTNDWPGNGRAPAQPEQPPVPSAPPAPSAPPPPSPPGQGGGGYHQQDRVRVQIMQRGEANRQGFPFFNTLARGRYYYIDITHGAYWRTIAITNILLPLCCAALLALTFYVRRLYLRNREYQERIESQKNLVVLGAAASTLAHEIKNPLLSIRLQTGILGKLRDGGGREELNIINEEVDRLSALIYRINDYLRDARGEPVIINAASFLRETGERLCGKNIVQEDSAKDAEIFMDAERARSVFENIIRNAMESGSVPEEISVSVSGGHGVIISVYDRGRGIPAADLKRIFDPFFTSKSTGTGIGLSISRRFVEAAGGNITAENREGGGCVIRIHLPGNSQG